MLIQLAIYSSNIIKIIKNLMLEIRNLSEINHLSRQNDITYFDSLWSSTGQELRRTLDFLCKNWQSYLPFYEEELETFQDLLDSKIKSVKHFEKWFPGLVKVIEQVELSNEYKGNFKKIDLQDSVTELLLKHFISDMSTRSQRSGNYYLRDQATGQKVTLEDYIAKCLLFLTSQRLEISWQCLFSKIEHQLIKEQNLMESEYVREIEKERLLPLNCLGCCPFFYAGCNIYNPAVNSTPLVVLSSVSRIRQLESQLKDEACLLLNEHGGVILFDCTMRSREVFPVGDIMSLHLKDEISQTINSYFQGIYPPLEPANFTVSFVPVVKNPLQGGRMGKKVIVQGSYENSYYQREYIEGVYVTRIKINPTVPERLYFWSNDLKHIFPMKIGNKITALPGRKVSQLIKQRFKKYYIPENGRDSDQMRFMSPRLSYFHDGECIRAELGIQVVNIPPVIRKPLQNFKHISLIMARKADLATIKGRLHKHGIACQIQNKYEQYRFKFSVNTAILYHNTRFDVLLAEVSHKKEFQFGGRYLTLLCVTPFIKLVERNSRTILPEDDFLNIYNFFSKEYSPKTLKLWRYNSQGEVEFYFHTANRIQTIFLYYILNHMGERAMLKNPKNFDKLTQEDINYRMQLFYPRNEQHLQSALKLQLKVKAQ